jgi:hypothetical protein
MKGLELAEKFYQEVARPLLAERLSEFEQRIAVGLVGEGSECFGFDDEISRDHDWGPGFCMWLTAGDYAEIGAELQRWYDELPKWYLGFGPKTDAPRSTDRRTGVFEIKDFYRRFVRYDHVPTTLGEWRALPETYLATATNGKVFTDPLGEFTAFREGLLAFYPEDLRLKKLAARCFVAGQTGQYNYKRSVARGEFVAAHCGLSQFVEAVVSIVYLVNKRYRPFYKWMHRGMKELPLLGASCHRMLADLCAETGKTGAELFAERERIVEEVSALIIDHLTFEGFSDSESDFLLDHAYSVQERIRNDALRGMPVMME